jgi:hypothetical protein
MRQDQIVEVMSPQALRRASSLVSAAYVAHVERHLRGSAEQREHAAALTAPQTAPEQALVGLVAAWVAMAHECEVETRGSLAAYGDGRHAAEAIGILQGAYALSYTAPAVGRVLRDELRALMHDVATAAGYPAHWRDLQVPR